MYEDMKRRIESAGEKGCVPQEIKDRHKGFLEWGSKITKQDHQSIVQILIDGWNSKATDIDENRLPTLVYLSREKRPGWAHNFKAGSMNSLIELAGLDGFGGALYIGTGCFHRRESLLGKVYSKDHRLDLQSVEDNVKGRTVEELEAASKPLADCRYENGTLWGEEMGLVYGYPVEDIVTGLTIQCRGWNPVYYNPGKNAFLGVAPTTLDIALIQFKRWSEGMFQIFFSKYCPFIYGHGKIKMGAQMGYCIYLLWALVSLPTLCYSVVPALCLVLNVLLFPKMSSWWFIPFAYVFAAKTAYSLVEELSCGGTLRGWWNLQRMWLFRRTTSYFFAFIDTVSKHLGFSQTSFALTAKVVDDEVRKRYEKEIIEFGSSSIVHLMMGTLAFLNLFSFGYGIKNAVFCGAEALAEFMPQIIVSGLIVMVNYPVYEAFFIRRDKEAYHPRLCSSPSLYSIRRMPHSYLLAPKRLFLEILGMPIILG
ncbi:UNVERIFIED_CONTAM: Cellulose synthase-like protein E6 [Sesamum angustifolium]|uniref:Cellulose synthase-like protein E6 n=1 Tax=Sesamum angustifolium TaxID=2727405 RepID=A0AAW2KV60_9LAMI